MMLRPNLNKEDVKIQDYNNVIKKINIIYYTLMAYIDQLLNSYTYRSIFVTVLSETGLTKDLLGKVFKN